MHRDWESEFSAWALPPSKTEEHRSENTIRAIRQATQANLRLSRQRIKVFTQGSYRNRVNVRHDSDVDVGVMLYSSFLGQYPEGRTKADFGLADADYFYYSFKNDLEEALATHFGRNSVARGNKSFKIKQSTARIEADVAPFIEFRRYSNSGNYQAGVAILPDRGGRIENYPERLIDYWPPEPLHYENGNSKNSNTRRRYRGVVRILKKLRNEMDGLGYSSASAIPGYLLECMIWNAPDDRFSRLTWDARVQAVVAHLWSNTKDEHSCRLWREVDNIKYLFHTAQPWTRSAAHAFIDEAWSYVGVR